MFIAFFLAKRNDGDPSLSRNGMETSSLAHFCTRIHELWLVLWNSSICPKTEPPRVSDMYCLKWKNGDSSPSRKRMETSTLTHHCVRIHEMWLVLQNPFICIKTEPPCVTLACFGQKEGWRVFYLLELDGNFRSCSFLHEDSWNVVSSSKFNHLSQKGATVCSRPLLAKRKKWRLFSIS